MDINNINIEEIVKQVLKGMTTGNIATPVVSAVSKNVPETCRAAVLTGIKNFEIKEFPIPEISDDEILVKVEGCGICGTDAHEYKKDPFNLIPVVLGHEGTGEVVKLGKNVTVDSSGKAVALGDKVLTCITVGDDPILTMTDPGRANLSDKADVYGLLPDDNYHLNGWFADYIILRKNSTFFQVNDMSLDLRILVEPAAVVVHAVERGKTTGMLKFDSRVVIQGCGPIGLMLMAVVRTLGVNHIIALDGDSKRLDFAKRLGAETCINIRDYKTTDETMAAVEKACGNNRLADFGFQCTGVPAAASNIWKFIRKGGALCELGFFVDNGNSTINPHYDICKKEMTVVGSWTYTARDYPTTFDFLKRAQDIGLPITDFITHRFSLEQMTEAMEANITQAGIKIAYVAK